MGPGRSWPPAPTFSRTRAGFAGRCGSSSPGRTSPLAGAGLRQGDLCRAALGADHPEVNLLAIDIKSDILAVARRNIQAAYHEAGREVDNLRLCAYEIGLIHTLLSPEDVVEKIFINFPNPWPHTGHRKKRLTHPKQLVLYASFLADGGEILMKTDDEPLFRDTRNT